MQAPEDGTAPLVVTAPALLEAPNDGFNMRDAVTVLGGPVTVVVQVLPPEVKVSVARPAGPSVSVNLPIIL